MTSKPCQLYLGSRYYPILDVSHTPGVDGFPWPSFRYVGLEVKRYAPRPTTRYINSMPEWLDKAYTKPRREK